MTDTKKNYIYNLTLNLSNIILGILIMPYISRKLGSNGIGIYSYTHSIAAYFILFSLLGIQNYGNRIIAEFKDNKVEKSRQFLSLYTLQISISLIVLGLYFVYIFLICKDNHLVALAQGIYLLSAIFDITWFFYGNQDFKPALVIGTITKFIYFILILLFVKGPQDIIIYTIIISLYSLLNNILFFPLLKKRIILTKFKKEDILKHLRPCLFLFIPVLSVSIYKIMDKIMLGAISGTLEVGFYEQAEKIINVPLQFIGVLGTVMFPKMSNLMVSGKEETVKRYISLSIDFIMFLIIPMSLGLICVADEFVPLFLGNEFIKSGLILKGLSISVIFIAWGNVIRLHYIVPKKMDKLFAKSVFFGAIINVLLNSLLIRKFNSFGAVVATIVAEFSVVLYQTLSIKNELPFLKYFKSICIIILKSIIMSVFVILIGLIKFPNIYLKLSIQIVVGIFVYSIFNIKYIKSLLVGTKISKLLKNHNYIGSNIYLKK